MAIEIEAKMKIDSHDGVIALLSSAGGEFIGDYVQRDIYFDDSDSSIRQADKALRIRYQTLADESICIVTYKGPKQSGDYKTRQEIEFTSSDLSATEEFFNELGYTKSITIEKRRQVWRLADCEIALDSLPLLGNFIEIESPDSAAIRTVQNQLSLGDLAHIQTSYADLLQNYARENNIGSLEFIFD